MTFLATTHTFATRLFHCAILYYWYQTLLCWFGIKFSRTKPIIVTVKCGTCHNVYVNLEITTGNSCSNGYFWVVVRGNIGIMKSVQVQKRYEKPQSRIYDTKIRLLDSQILMLMKERSHNVYFGWKCWLRTGWSRIH